ncbi:hypothetical protein BC835DRAFT_1394792, partial [Cytidiella melzeri]
MPRRYIRSSETGPLLFPQNNNNKLQTIVGILPGADRTLRGGGRALARCICRLGPVFACLCRLGPVLACLCRLGPFLAFTRFVHAEIKETDSSFSRFNSDHDDRVRGRLRRRMGAEERGGGDYESLDRWMALEGKVRGKVSRDGKATRLLAQETARNAFPVVVDITTRSNPAVEEISRATPRVLWTALLLSKDDG